VAVGYDEEAPEKREEGRVMDDVEKKAVQEALQKLERAGRFTPDDVIEAARSKRSALHRFFDWDDKSAAHEHRIYQARKLISGVRVEITIHSRTLSTIGYVHDPRAGNNEQGYVSTIQIRKEPENLADMMTSELSRARSALERVENLADTFGMRGKIRRNIKSLSKMLDELAEGGEELTD